MKQTVNKISRLDKNIPQRAVILAAGYGMRMVPINTETPKGLLEINGEPLIERIIKQLKQVNIHEIYVVVGFMKEKYEYLIDIYNVKLIYNPEYSSKNNLHSLKYVKNYLNDSYIIPCDIWCRHNPFSKNESHSWYMVSDLADKEHCEKENNRLEMLSKKDTDFMIGIAYLLKEDADIVIKRLNTMCKNSKYDDCFWEETLYKNDRMFLSNKVVDSRDVVEINTYEQLRRLDESSNNLKDETIQVICDVLKAEPMEIENIEVLKKGMTNRSFLFRCKNKKYIMRIPGKGTEKLIKRREEAEVYNVIKERNICDNIVYINSENGYKITEFLENARVCNPNNFIDVKKCMKRLREFHNLRLKVEHSFDLFKQIDFYESLREGKSSIYKDYSETKEKILSLKEYINKNIKERVLTHIDAVPDNFLIISNKENEEIKLIDWEYAGMQDPHVDIAMFCIYSMYDKLQIDRTIQAYFIEGVSENIKAKIDCYVAVCGLLWSNWCEYKKNLGVEFGEYSLKQYQYAKEYYEIAKEKIEDIEMRGKR